MTNKRRAVPGVHPYDGPAGGWGALRATAIAVRTQMDAFEAPATLLRTNQPDGFDCPGCAWPDKEHKSTFQFCENGAKAVTWEATTKRVTPAFLAANTVSSLLAKSDFGGLRPLNPSFGLRPGQRYPASGGVGASLRPYRRDPPRPAAG